MLENNKSNIYFNKTFNKSRLKNLIYWSINVFGEKKTVDLIEILKTIGYSYATKAGLSLSIDDLKIPIVKNQLLVNAESKLEYTSQDVEKGYLTSIEYFAQVIDTWNNTNEQLKQEVITNFKMKDALNPVYMMAFSGARGNISQVRQLVGMRGLMADPGGRIIDFPIQSNFREGLTLTEYIISCYGARKGVVDTALRTATSGYLTRRLVDVAQHVIIRIYDCSTLRGISLDDLKNKTNKKPLLALKNRLIGRVLAEDVYDFTLKKIAVKNQEITSELATLLLKTKKRVFVRSPLTCQDKNYVCQLCYGWSLSYSRLVPLGESVGIIAAQSIGEPGTQLTMRTFHTGGVFSGDISDQIRTPFNSIIEYPQTISGQLVRTNHGQLAFLTKQTGFCLLKNQNQICKINLPTYTLLFVKQNQKLYKNQVFAESAGFLTEVDTQNSIDAFQTVYSEFSGEIRFKKTKIFQQLQNKNKILTTNVNSQIGEFWLLSSQKQSLLKPLTLFIKTGDFIFLNSFICLYSIKLSFPFLKLTNATLNNFIPFSQLGYNYQIVSPLAVLPPLSVDKEMKIQRTKKQTLDEYLKFRITEKRTKNALIHFPSTNNQLLFFKNLFFNFFNFLLNQKKLNRSTFNLSSLFINYSYFNRLSQNSEKQIFIQKTFKKLQKKSHFNFCLGSLMVPLPYSSFPYSSFPSSSPLSLFSSEDKKSFFLKKQKKAKCYKINNILYLNNNLKQIYFLPEFKIPSGTLGFKSKLLLTIDSQYKLILFDLQTTENFLPPICFITNYFTGKIKLKNIQCQIKKGLVLKNQSFITFKENKLYKIVYNIVRKHEFLPQFKLFFHTDKMLTIWSLDQKIESKTNQLTNDTQFRFKFPFFFYYFVFNNSIFSFKKLKNNKKFFISSLKHFSKITLVEFFDPRLRIRREGGDQNIEKKRKRLWYALLVLDGKQKQTKTIPELIKKETYFIFFSVLPVFDIFTFNLKSNIKENFLFLSQEKKCQTIKISIDYKKNIKSYFISKTAFYFSDFFKESQFKSKFETITSKTNKTIDMSSNCYFLKNKRFCYFNLLKTLYNDNFVSDNLNTQFFNKQVPLWDFYFLSKNLKIITTINYFSFQKNFLQIPFTNYANLNISTDFDQTRLILSKSIDYINYFNINLINFYNYIIRFQNLNVSLFKKLVYKQRNLLNIELVKSQLSIDYLSNHLFLPSFYIDFSTKKKSNNLNNCYLIFKYPYQTLLNNKQLNLNNYLSFKKIDFFYFETNQICSNLLFNENSNLSVDDFLCFFPNLKFNLSLQRDGSKNGKKVNAPENSNQLLNPKSKNFELTNSFLIKKRKLPRLQLICPNKKQNSHFISFGSKEKYKLEKTTCWTSIKNFSFSTVNILKILELINTSTNLKINSSLIHNKTIKRFLFFPIQFLPEVQKQRSKKLKVNKANQKKKTVLYLKQEFIKIYLLNLSLTFPELLPKETKEEKKIYSIQKLQFNLILCDFIFSFFLTNLNILLLIMQRICIFDTNFFIKVHSFNKNTVSKSNVSFTVFDSSNPSIGKINKKSNKSNKFLKHRLNKDFITQLLLEKTESSQLFSLVPKKLTKNKEKQGFQITKELLSFISHASIYKTISFDSLIFLSVSLKTQFLAQSKSTNLKLFNKNKYFYSNEIDNLQNKNELFYFVNKKQNQFKIFNLWFRNDQLQKVKKKEFNNKILPIKQAETKEYRNKFFTLLLTKKNSYSSSALIPTGRHFIFLSTLGPWPTITASERRTSFSANKNKFAKPMIDNTISAANYNSKFNPIENKKNSHLLKYYNFKACYNKKALYSFDYLVTNPTLNFPLSCFSFNPLQNNYGKTSYDYFKNNKKQNNKNQINCRKQINYFNNLFYLLLVEKFKKLQKSNSLLNLPKFILPLNKLQKLSHIEKIEKIEKIENNRQLENSPNKWFLNLSNNLIKTTYQQKLYFLFEQNWIYKTQNIHFQFLFKICHYLYKINSFSISNKQLTKANKNIIVKNYLKKNSVILSIPIRTAKFQFFNFFFYRQLFLENKSANSVIKTLLYYYNTNLQKLILLSKYTNPTYEISNFEFSNNYCLNNNFQLKILSLKTKLVLTKNNLLDQFEIFELNLKHNGKINRHFYQKYNNLNYDFVVTNYIGWIYHTQIKVKSNFLFLKHNKIIPIGHFNNNSIIFDNKVTLNKTLFAGFKNELKTKDIFFNTLFFKKFLVISDRKNLINNNFIFYNSKFFKNSLEKRIIGSSQHSYSNTFILLDKSLKIKNQKLILNTILPNFNLFDFLNFETNSKKKQLKTKKKWKIQCIAKLILFMKFYFYSISVKVLTKSNNLNLKTITNNSFKKQRNIFTNYCRSYFLQTANLIKINNIKQTISTNKIQLILYFYSNRTNSKRLFLIKSSHIYFNNLTRYQPKLLIKSVQKQQINIKLNFANIATFFIVQKAIQFQNINSLSKTLELKTKNNLVITQNDLRCYILKFLIKTKIKKQKNQLIFSSKQSLPIRKWTLFNSLIFSSNKKLLSIKNKNILACIKNSSFQQKPFLIRKNLTFSKKSHKLQFQITNSVKLKKTPLKFFINKNFLIFEKLNNHSKTSTFLLIKQKKFKLYAQINSFHLKQVYFQYFNIIISLCSSSFISNFVIPINSKKFNTKNINSNEYCIKKVYQTELINTTKNQIKPLPDFLTFINLKSFVIPNSTYLFQIHINLKNANSFLNKQEKRHFISNDEYKIELMKIYNLKIRQNIKKLSFYYKSVYLKNKEYYKKGNNKNYEFSLFQGEILNISKFKNDYLNDSNLNVNDKQNKTIQKVFHELQSSKQNSTVEFELGSPTEPLALYKKSDSAFSFGGQRQTKIIEKEFFYLTNEDFLTYKLSYNKNIKFKLILGCFLPCSTEILPKLSIDQSGQIIFINKKKIILRRAKVFLLSAGCICNLKQGDFVNIDSPLLTLTYKNLKTEDIVQGIPKIEQIFEARENVKEQSSLNSLIKIKFKHYQKIYSKKEAVQKSIVFIQQYIVDSVQNVYQSQGVNISDKHIEIIVKQMTSKVRITNPGSTGLLRGDIVYLDWIELINIGLKGKKAQYEPVILGITKACLEMDGFIAAASFQETIKILSRAAILQKRDFLRGLKENLILGHLVPTGTGFEFPI